ncbi:MAG: exopolysaccharide biosynthesis polyprenyl glycosylphosphotransferase, partial [Pseudomonadota bacterium]|nr:exopolysaccharide biosynthesis polyprenyl glycosylphosphotransferase [Pseudomonadota bacterium]
AGHAVWWSRVEAWRKAGRLTPNVVVVCATPNAQRLIEAAIKSKDVAILGVFDDRAARSPDDVAGVPVLGDTNALMSHPLLPFVDRIVITVPASAQARVRTLIDRLRVLPNAVTLFMDVEGAEARDAALSRLASASIAQVSGGEADERRAFGKRVQDLVIGSLALLIALPVMAVIAVLVKLDSPGPALFRQRRHGFNNEVITVWKFRSMRVEAADATASRQVSQNDDRVTRVGRIIRKLSLDELPQLINVARGEMSLVGPRPHATGMKTAGEESAKLVAEYAWRHRMKPGLTGWAQINGSIGAVDTPEAVRRRVALDIEYIESQSFWFDLYILAMTIPALVMARNTVR